MLLKRKGNVFFLFFYWIDLTELFRICRYTSIEKKIYVTFQKAKTIKTLADRQLTVLNFVGPTRNEGVKFIL